MLGKIHTTCSETLLTLALLFLAVPAASAGVIFQDDFNAETYGIPTASLTNWNIDLPSIDVVGAGGFGYLCNNNTAGNCLDMDGSPGNGQMTTKIGLNLAAGTYSFSFDYGNNAFNNNTLSWNIGTIISGIINSGAANNNTYTNFSTSFTLNSAVSNVFLTFASGGPADNGGTVLDNVLLESTSVPEPASLLLIALGLLGLALKRKQNSKERDVSNGVILFD